MIKKSLSINSALHLNKPLLSKNRQHRQKKKEKCLKILNHPICQKIPQEQKNDYFQMMRFFFHFYLFSSYLVWQLLKQFYYWMDYLKITSDLFGIRTSTGMKRSYMKDQKFDKDALTQRSYSNYETKCSAMLAQNSPESPNKKVQVRQLVNDCRKLLKFYYQEHNQSFYLSASNYLKEGWQSQRKLLEQHLNKTVYLQQSIQMKTYPEIQIQVIKQWKKSPILHNIRKLWYQQGNKDIKNIHQFIENYKLFAQFIGQLAFLYFKSFFFLLEKKSDFVVLDKLTERTAHLIITNSNLWCKLFDSKIRPLIKKQIYNYPTYIENFNINSLQMPEHIILPQVQSNQFVQTTKRIYSFLTEYKMQQKIKVLRQIRQILDYELIQKQKKLIDEGKIDEYKVLEKDDFISCLIYCIVKGDISVQKLGVCLKYFQYLLGENMSPILSQFGCSSYLTDIEAAVMYLINVEDEDKDKGKTQKPEQIVKKQISKFSQQKKTEITQKIY